MVGALNASHRDLAELFQVKVSSAPVVSCQPGLPADCDIAPAASFFPAETRSREAGSSLSCCVFFVSLVALRCRAVGQK